jgi:hypothetical protein
MERARSSNQDENRSPCITWKITWKNLPGNTSARCDAFAVLRSRSELIIGRDRLDPV